MKRIYLYIFIILLVAAGCKKFVTIDQLDDNLLASQVFSNAATANNAIAGIYKTAKITYSATASISYQTGLSADELAAYSNPNNFQNNSLLVTDAVPWGQLYKIIYQCNDAIEGLSGGTLNEDTKNIFTGEAKFMRAYAYLYLVNLFGDAPLIISTNVATNAVLPRTPVSEIYAQIIRDLEDVQSMLGPVNPYAKGEKIRVTSLAVKALLARVYLYQKNWDNAYKYANELINNQTIRLDTPLTDVFKKNSNEAILQLANNSSEKIDEAGNFVYTTTPLTTLTNSLFNSFEAGDLRKSKWIRSTMYQGVQINVPYKYTSISINPPEYYMLLRLGEQYLIRAEASAMLNNFDAAIADVNTIRSKHGGLNIPLPTPADQSSCIDIILHERRVELFAETGHRWIDLKRLGKIDAVITAEKPGKWETTDALWPIPLGDMQKNPNLEPNPGYEQ